MKIRECLLTMIIAVAASVPASLQEVGGEEETGPYDVVPQWLKPLPTHNAEWGWGNAAGVFAQSPDRIFVLTRGDLPKPPVRTPRTLMLTPQQVLASNDTRKQNFVVVVNRNGEMVDNWTQWDSMIRVPHRIKINPYDPEKHVWIMDHGRQQVMKFTNDGKKMVMAIGVAEQAGNDHDHLGGVVDIDWLPDGTILVADGGEPVTVTSRVVKYTADGKYISEWGGNGEAPGQFRGTHGIAVDAQRRVYVADRGNRRMQVFDENGKLLKIWPNLRQMDYILAAPDGFLWGVDGMTNKVLKYDLEGHLKYAWGTQGSFDGGMSSPHGMSVDQEGNLYIADFFNQRVQKFQPRKGADKSRLIPRPIAWPAKK